MTSEGGWGGWGGVVRVCVCVSLALCLSRYKRHLKAIYIVHPTWWFKVGQQSLVMVDTRQHSPSSPAAGLVVPDLHSQ